jgi:hypothetical protein
MLLIDLVTSEWVLQKSSNNIDKRGGYACEETQDTGNCYQLGRFSNYLADAFFRRDIISLVLGFFLFLVLPPLAGLAQGDMLDFRPPEVFPSPPPWGWSMGFIATPRTVGRHPSHRDLPAFPQLMLW